MSKKKVAGVVLESREVLQGELKGRRRGKGTKEWWTQGRLKRSEQKKRKRKTLFLSNVPFI